VGFLAAGAAVGVPILIHLLFRQRARRVEIGTLHFLRVVLRDQARRRKIRRWLLLALRAAALLLLALVFARPYRRAPETPGRDQELILLVDRSASMAAGAAGASPFDKAQRQAGQILQTLPDGAAAHLAYFDADGVVPSREPRVDGALRPGLAATDYGRAIAWARDIVAGSRRAQQRLVVLTDLQRCGLGPPSAAPFPASPAVEIIDAGRPLTRNLAVEEVQVEATDLRAGNFPRIAARVFNAGLFPARDVAVKLVLDGQARIEQTISIEGRARQLVRFEVPIQEPGMYSGYVEITGTDDLPFDDRRWLAFEARLPERLLLIDGEPGPTVFADETYYLEMALKLRLPGEESGAATTPYEPTRLAWSGADPALPDLNPFRVVVLCNVAAVAPAAAGALARFVKSGGRLIIFPGELVEEAGYAALEEARVLPARIGEPVATGLYRFDQWEKAHPIFHPFSDPQHGDLRTVRFRRIARLVPDPESRVLATAHGGLPLLVERKSGDGRCLLFAFPADNAWGEWAIHRLYLPLVHQIVAYLTNRLPEAALVRVERAGKDPDRAPGVAMEKGVAVVRNVDPAESDIERTTVDRLREVYGLPEARGSAAPAEADTQLLAGGDERPDELWRWIGWGLLIVLVGETLVANRTYA
jgi:Aerotolerance regulator N-terminal